MDHNSAGVLALVLVSASVQYPTDDNCSQFSTSIQSQDCRLADSGIHSIQTRYWSCWRDSHLPGTGAGQLPTLRNRNIANSRWCRLVQPHSDSFGCWAVEQDHMLVLVMGLELASEWAQPLRRAQIWIACKRVGSLPRGSGTIPLEGRSCHIGLLDQYRPLIR